MAKHLSESTDNLSIGDNLLEDMGISPSTSSQSNDISSIDNRSPLHKFVKENDYINRVQKPINLNNPRVNSGITTAILAEILNNN